MAYIVSLPSSVSSSFRFFFLALLWEKSAIDSSFRLAHCKYPGQKKTRLSVSLSF